MHFRIEQLFDAPLLDVEDALIDPAFLASLAALPKLGRPTLLDQQPEGRLLRQRVRYAFAGDLSSAVRAVVDPERLTWVEDSTMDRARHHTSFRIVPDHYAHLLRAAGTFQLDPEGPTACRRVAEGDVQVAVPLVGKKVEAAIVSGLTEHARAETEIMHEWLAGTGPRPRPS